MYKQRKAQMKEINTNVVIQSTKYMVSAGLDKLSPNLYREGIPKHLNPLRFLEEGVATKLARIISQSDTSRIQIR